MKPKIILLALVTTAGTGFLLYALFGAPRLVPLRPLETPPRPPVVADRSSPAQLLMGLHDPFPESGVEDLVNAKRKARNDLAERHAAAVAAWKKGKTSLRTVESIEEMLVVARARTGEITPREMHEQLAFLFEREVERLEKLMKTGHAGAGELARARLYLARELYMAGRADTDPRAAAYPEARARYLADLKGEFDALVESNLAKRAYVDLEYSDLLEDFPEPPPIASPTPEEAPAGSGAGGSGGPVADPAK